MNDVLSKAREHFRGQITGEMNFVKVPEWKDSIIWYKPMTAKQADAIMKFVNDGAMFGAMVEALIQRARNEDGSRMFRPNDRNTFMTQTDRKIIEKIVTEMKSLESLVDDDEDIEGEEPDTSVKNS